MKCHAFSIPCACVALMVGCSSSDVIVANVLPDTGDAEPSDSQSSDAQPTDAQVEDARGPDGWSSDAQSNDSGGQGPPCTTSNACNQGLFCQKKACGDPTGTCQPRPGSCSSAFSPVCDCNGVAYSNDCLRRLYGVESATPVPLGGKCSVPATCTVPYGTTCPVPRSAMALATCAHMVQDASQCVVGSQSNLTGECWVVPLSCPSVPGIYAECYKPVPGVCHDICQALTEGYEHYPVTVCP
jgi:hypothetical protein